MFAYVDAPAASVVSRKFCGTFVVLHDSGLWVCFVPRGGWTFKQFASSALASKDA